MKITELPSYEECAELMEKGEANFLHIFICENEPIDESGIWRKQLADAITRIQRDAIFEAWENKDVKSNIEDYVDECYPLQA